jgi:hypothetical protein
MFQPGNDNLTIIYTSLLKREGIAALQSGGGLPVGGVGDSLVSITFYIVLLDL